MKLKNETDTINIELQVLAVHNGEDVWMQGDAYILINGEKIYGESDIVQVDSFFESMKVDGDYFIFSCICGVPECSSWKIGIKVIQTEHFIEWTNLNNKKTWKFNKSNVFDQLDILKKEVLFYKKHFEKKDIQYVGVGYTW